MDLTGHFIFNFFCFFLQSFIIIDKQQQQQQNGQLRSPKIKEHPISMVVKKHDPTQLECKADGNPKPIIEW